MARCDDAGCSCNIQAGPGITIEGAGSTASPMVISSDLALSQSLIVNDTDTLNLNLFGGGVPGDPLILSGTVTMKLTQLTDYNDPGGPVAGDVVTWVGSGPTGHWEAAPAPTAPAGSVNVSDGITGTGAALTPIKVKVIGTNAGGPTSGLEVYVDSAGNLRTVAPAGTTVDWSAITGKPTTFPPSPHTHVAADITNPLALSVGNSAKVGGHTIFVQATTPAGPVTDDLWFY